MVQEKSTKEVYAMKVMKKAHILQQSDVCSCVESTHISMSNVLTDTLIF